MTIYDFGCAPAVTMTALVQALKDACLCLALLAELAALGSLILRERRFQPVHIFCGWGLISIVMTAGMIFWPQTFPMIRWVISGLFFLVLIIAARRHYFQHPFWLLILFPGLMLILCTDLAGIAKWDDFSHWVPNALYLFRYDALPSAHLPAPHSVWPGYPYALPFLTYLASWSADGFIMQGGAMFNLLMLMAFAGMLAALPQENDTPNFSRREFGLLAVALLCVTLLNPSFNASFTITSQGDTGTMIVTAALGILLWQFVNALDARTPALGRLRLKIALLAALLLLLKQGNLALLGLLVIGFLLAAARNRQFLYGTREVPIFLLLAVPIRLLWDHYVAHELGGNGFQFHFPAHWRFDLLAPLLHAMLHEALRKSGCFGLMLGIIIAGGIAFFRAPNPKRNFLILAAIVSAGYWAFLVLCYLGASFSENEIRRAASFYRYSTHVGLLNMAVLWVYAPDLWGWVNKYGMLAGACPRTGLRPDPGASMTPVFIAASICILPLVLLIHRDWLIPDAGPQICTYRQIGRTVAAQLPDQTRLGVVDPEGDGLLAYVINFQLALDEAQHTHSTRVVWQRDQFSGGNVLSEAATQMQNGQLNALYVPQAKTHPVTIMGFDNHAPLLLVRTSDGSWQPAQP